MSVARSIAVALLAVSIGCGRTGPRFMAGDTPEQRAIQQRWYDDCQRAQAVIEAGPPRGPLHPDFVWAVTTLPCPAKATSGALIARAWQGVPADNKVIARLVASSVETGGQRVFRTALQVARDTGRATITRLGAIRVLAVYIDAHMLFDELPPDTLRITMGFVDHASFNGGAEYEAFAPDTVMAVLRLLGSSGNDSIRRSAARVREVLAYTYKSAEFKANEAARRTHAAARAVGCYVIRYGAAPGSAAMSSLAGAVDSVALRAQQDYFVFSSGRLVEPRRAGKTGSWYPYGADSIQLYHSRSDSVLSIMFPVDGTLGRVTVLSDTSHLSATVRRIGCWPRGEVSGIR